MLQMRLIEKNFRAQHDSESIIFALVLSIVRMFRLKAVVLYSAVSSRIMPSRPFIYKVNIMPVYVDLMCHQKRPRY